MNPEGGAETQKSLREQIKGDVQISEMLESGTTHDQILAEVEDFVEDQFGYNKVVAICEQALADPALDAETRSKYEGYRNYANMVMKANPGEYEA